MVCLPAVVDLVDHCVQGVPDGVLGGDVDAVHLAADGEVGAGMDAEAGAADDAVKQELELGSVGGVGGGDQTGLVGVELRDVCVEVALQADLVVGKGVGREGAGGQLACIDEFDRGDLVGKGTRGHAAAAGAVRDGQFRAELDRTRVIEQPVPGHGVLGAIEDGECVRVGGGHGKVPVRECTGVAAVLAKIRLV